MGSHAAIPLTLFLCIAVAVSIYFYMQFLARKAMQETLRSAITAGQKLDDETIKAMSQKVPSTPEADLQSGIKDTAFGIGAAVASMVASTRLDEDFAGILLIVGIIFIAYGVGGIASWKVRTVKIR